MHRERDELAGSGPTISAAIAQTRRHDFMARAEADRLGRAAKAAAVASNRARGLRLAESQAAPGKNRRTALSRYGRLTWLRRLSRLGNSTAGIS